MLSKEQQLQKDLNILKTTNLFLAKPMSMEELSNKTGFSASSCQRYLNDKRIIELLDKDVFNEIQNILKIQKHEALSKGGFISTKNNIAIRDENGKFIGNKSK